MKKTFTLAVVACFCATMAQAQNGTETTRQMKVAPKESMRAAQPESKKVNEQVVTDRAASAQHVGATKEFLTEEQVRTRSEQKAAAAEPKAKDEN
ncbi:MAG: hypothetical protein GC178_06030 [Flavobacteriales bacterium]|nr:hypothetical protein [Flavobacteriales bacterium]